MCSLPSVLADVFRIRQFSLLAHRSVFDSATVSRDSRGMSWLIAETCHGRFAIPSIGAGWHFDAAARQQWQSRHLECLERLGSLSDSQVEEELRSAAEGFRFGSLSERLVWAVHREVLRQRQSCLEIPEEWLCSQIWSDNRPAHWRSELRAMLTSLSLLHICNSSDDFGDSTAILTHFRVRSRGFSSACPAGCRWENHGRHGHVLINIGRGFLGCLERLTDATGDTAVRRYQLAAPTDSSKIRKAKEARLKLIGRSGHLTSLFVPTKLGAPDVLKTFSRLQLGLLQEIYRERVRTSKRDQDSIDDSETRVGPLVPPIAANRRECPAPMIICPQLQAGQSYCGFNGNGVRKERGYKLNTWVSRTGYRTARQFLNDLLALSQRLGLTIAALAPNQNIRTGLWLDGESLLALVLSRPGVADRYHLRIYAAEGFLLRWCEVLEWSVDSPQCAESDTSEQMLHLMSLHRMRQCQVADALGIDRSAFSKMLNRKRNMPDRLLSLFKGWLEHRHENDQLSIVCANS